MIGQESTVFPKQIKIDDYSEFSEDNVVRILETSNLLVGSGARTSNAVPLNPPRLSYLSRHFTTSTRST